jgi:hypothetical protein
LIFLDFILCNDEMNMMWIKGERNANGGRRAEN